DPNIPWFDLTKPQRRAVRAANKIRVPNLAPDVYNEIDMLMTRMNQVSPTDTPIEPAPTSVLLVDQENQHCSTFTTFGNSSVSSCSGHNDSATNQNGNNQSGQFTCECGAKRLLDIAPAGLTMTSNGTLQHQQHHANRPVPIPSAQNVQTPSYYSSQQVAGQGAPKRQRTMQEQSIGMIDSQTAREFMEQMRLSQAKDREERRQQHIEQMSALREIAALLKQRR
ncbi:hypothetical protein GN958_ATG20013, partial [Phytophthora infestans]